MSTVPPRTRAVVSTLLAAALVGLLLGVGACTGHGRSAAAKAGDTARSFLQSWSNGALERAAGLTDKRARAGRDLRSVPAGLHATDVTFEAQRARVDGDRARVAFSAHWTITGVTRQWTYTGELPLSRGDGGHWRVDWAASDIHPKLRAGQQLSAVRALPDRAAILDDRGRSLFAKVPVVEVGIEPKLVTDLGGVAATLARTLHVSAADIVADVRKAAPTAFVPVITLRRSDYLPVRSAIHDLPGTVFQTSTQLLAPTPQFAKLLLGRVGPATAEVLKSLGAGYVASDQVGLSGLQGALNKQLTGQAGATIQVSGNRSTVDPGGGSTSADAATIGRIAAVPGEPVATTLDVATQNAADAALASVPQQASIVAIRPSTGQVLAVANSPSATYDIALEGQYPAGSTFKIVTASAVLEHHRVAANAVLPCPGQTTVYGKVFHNEDSFDLGAVPLQSAFAHSCNTTFTMLAEKLADSDLPDTAAQFGVGAGWSLPVPLFSGSTPTPRDPAERAADAIGQGRVLVSPFAMALVAATVPHGSTPTPMLLAGQPATPKQKPAAPPASVLAALKPFMRAVVTGGTATGLAGVPGGPVYGKTGTAEYGTATPPRSHAWFAGYQGDLAFAVFVADGESSKTTAVPISATFLRALSP